MKQRSLATFCSKRMWLVGIGLAVGLFLSAAVGAAGAYAQSSAANSGWSTTSPTLFQTCKGTDPDGTPVPHGLCAVATCFVFNNLAYCECDVAQTGGTAVPASGDNISLPFDFDNGKQDICTVNAAGVDNGYMASTFSFPPSVSATPPRRKSGALHVPAPRLEWNLRPMRRRDLLQKS